MHAAARPMVLIDAVRPTAWSDSLTSRLVMDFILMIGFAWFVALSAQIAVRLPWTTVPITGQTFAVLIAGGALGAWRGAGALLIYMIMGMLAVPVFAPGGADLGFQGEWGFHFIFPWLGTAALPWSLSSGGYLVGFIFAAFIVGYFTQRSWDRKPWGIAAMLSGNAVVYLFGLLWLYYLIASDWVPSGASQPLGEFISGSGAWDKTLKGGLYPFIVGDLMKLYLATLALPAAWLLVKRLKGGASKDD